MLIRTLFAMTVFGACLSPSHRDEDSFAGKPKTEFEKKLARKSGAEVDTLYVHICNNLERKRKALNTEWQKAATAAQKKTVLDKARTLLQTTLSDSLFVCWYGTGWDFNGTTSCPRQGNIACGYFVTTLLKQAGFNISRSFLAQQASSVMIKTFCPDDKVKTITNHQVQKVFDYMKGKADGVFLLGLDNHTGFLVKKGESVDFVDADYQVDKVVCEPMEKSKIIHDNGFFMIGDLLHSDETMSDWLEGNKIGD